MLSPRSWMWSSLGLSVVVGVCIGVVGDRLILQEDEVFADAAPRRSPHWFLCTERGSLDIEEEPGYLFSEEFRSRLLRELQESLELRSDQVASLEDYLEETRHGVHEFWEDSRHAFCDMRDGFRIEIREMLDDTQRDHWDEITADIDRREAEYVERLRREGAAERR